VSQLLDRYWEACGYVGVLGIGVSGYERECEEDVLGRDEDMIWFVKGAGSGVAVGDCQGDHRLHPPT